MDKYYFYIEKERTRIYTDKSNGKPIELNVDGVITTEIYNTYSFNLTKEVVDICPLNRSYELNHDNVFNLNMTIGGSDDDVWHTHMPIFFIQKVIQILDITEGEIRVLLSHSFREHLMDNGTEISKDYFTNVFKTINEMYDTNFICKGTYYVMDLVDSLFFFLSFDMKKNLLYIDEKMIKYRRNKMLEVMRPWGIKNKALEAEMDEYFIKMLKQEYLYSDINDYENIKSHILHEAKKGNHLNTITIHRRDEKFEIDCKIVHDFLKKTEESKYTNLLDFINTCKGTPTNIICLLNINNKTIKEKVENIIKEKQIKIYEKENYFSILLKFCEMIDKYNEPKYKNRILIISKKSRTSVDKLLILGKYYHIAELCVSEKEVKSICDFLGLSINNMVLKR